MVTIILQRSAGEAHLYAGCQRLQHRAAAYAQSITTNGVRTTTSAASTAFGDVASGGPVTLPIRTCSQWSWFGGSPTGPNATVRATGATGTTRPQAPSRIHERRGGFAFMCTRITTRDHHQQHIPRRHDDDMLVDSVSSSSTNRIRARKTAMRSNTSSRSWANRDWWPPFCCSPAAQPSGRSISLRTGQRDPARWFTYHVGYSCGASERCRRRPVQN